MAKIIFTAIAVWIVHFLLGDYRKNKKLNISNNCASGMNPTPDELRRYAYEEDFHFTDQDWEYEMGRTEFVILFCEFVSDKNIQETKRQLFLDSLYAITISEHDLSNLNSWGYSQEVKNKIKAEYLKILSKASSFSDESVQRWHKDSLDLFYEKIPRNLWMKKHSEENPRLSPVNKI